MFPLSFVFPAVVSPPPPLPFDANGSFAGFGVLLLSLCRDALDVLNGFTSGIPCGGG